MPFPLEAIPSAPTYEMDQARKQLDCAAGCCRRAANLMLFGMPADATRPIEEAITLLLLAMGGVNRHQIDLLMSRVAEMQARIDVSEKKGGA